MNIRKSFHILVSWVKTSEGESNEKVLAGSAAAAPIHAWKYNEKSQKQPEKLSLQNHQKEKQSVKMNFKLLIYGGWVWWWDILFHLKIQITIVIMIIVITITIATINRWLQFSCCPPFVHFHFHVQCFHFSAFTFTINSWLQFAGQCSTFNFYCFHFYFHNQ